LYAIRENLHNALDKTDKQKLQLKLNYDQQLKANDQTIKGLKWGCKIIRWLTLVERFSRLTELKERLALYGGSEKQFFKFLIYHEEMVRAEHEFKTFAESSVSDNSSVGSISDDGGVINTMSPHQYQRAQELDDQESSSFATRSGGV